MPRTASKVIVVSQRALVRDLLGELLRTRFAAQVIARCAGLQDSVAHLAGASLVVVDVDGIPESARTAFVERITGAHPFVSVVLIDESLGNFSVEDFASALRDSRPALPAAAELTRLETEVLLAVASGQKNSEIARRMRRSSKTVEKHRANLQRKLGLRTVAQLTAYALREGLLDGDAILEGRF